MFRKTILLTAILAASSAYATGKHEPAPPKSPPPAVTSYDASAEAAALAQAVSVALAAAGANAEASQANHQSMRQSNDQRTSQAARLDASQGNAQSTAYTDASVTLYAPSVIPPECGVGGNAGGSRNGDSAFLGVAWTTERCYSFRAAAIWAQLGSIDLACEMLADATRKQMKRRNVAVDCAALQAGLRALAAAASTPAPAPATAQYVTREELAEALTRAFLASQSK